MKKKYIAPATSLCQVELQQMIAQSTFSTEGDTQTITVSDEEADVFTSRRRDVWAEADEEEL